MNSHLATAILSIVLSIPPSLIGAENPTPDSRKAKWEFSERRPLGEREVSAGFKVWGPRPLLVIMLSSKEEDKKPIPISRLKVTALDNKGKPLPVAKHYEDGTLLVGREHHTAFFQVGTFVQNIQPKDVGSVTIAGFGGKLIVRFVDGDAQKEPNAE
jgi:hypothetical protein